MSLVLGEDYCPGYIDILGHWNTGFDCPSTLPGESIFCCGNENYKYCCSKVIERDEPLLKEDVSR